MLTYHQLRCNFYNYYLLTAVLFHVYPSFAVSPGNKAKLGFNSMHLIHSNSLMPIYFLYLVPLFLQQCWRKDRKVEEQEQTKGKTIV